MSTDDPRILIIDNHEAVAEAVAVRLQSAGYTTVTAYTGREGLAAFNDAPFDLIISDINMPDGDGVALAESIRRVSDAPIIFITGFAGEYEERMQALSRVTVLAKPFEEGTLLDLVEMDLALSRA